MRILLILLIFSTCSWAKGMALETITPQYRQANELATVIKPLLPEGGTVQTYNGQLIIQAPHKQIQSLKDLIAKLDTKPERLMISFSQGADKPTTQFTFDKDGKVEYSSDTPSKEHRRFYQTSRESNRSLSHLALNAGEKAFLKSGVSIPIVIYDEGYQHQANAQAELNRQSQSQTNKLAADVPTTAPTTIATPPNQNPFNPIISDPDQENPNSFILSVPPNDNALINTNPNVLGRVEVDLENTTSQSQLQAQRQFNREAKGFANSRIQKELQSGLYIEPTMVGSQVNLHVQSIEQRPHTAYQHQAAKDKPSYSTQSMETTLVVPLGTWIYLGGNQKETELTTNHWHFSSRDRKLERSHIWIRVDKLD